MVALQAFLPLWCRWDAHAAFFAGALAGAEVFVSADLEAELDGVSAANTGNASSDAVATSVDSFAIFMSIFSSSYQASIIARLIWHSKKAK